jgi:bifunctional UDP-N-acetylglucosamine pyrophosphorylase / glucosamine-1-phosphate N-acetyltransferase
MKLACVVLCAGKGTRMKSRLPKVLHPAAGRPLCAWPLLRAAAAGAEPIIAVVGHGAQLVQEVLSRGAPAGLRFAVQAEQRGTGHAVLCGLAALAERVDEVLVLYGDTPLLQQESLDALLARRREGGCALGLLTTRLEDPTGYGRIVRGAEGGIAKIVEHKDASEAERALTEVNPGIYVFDAAFLREGIEKLGTDNAQGELYLTDLVAFAAEAGGVAELFVPAEETLGVNDRVQLALVERVLRQRIRHRHMLAGVTLEDPSTTYIDDEVEIESDVVLEPGVFLRGKTRLHEGCRIGAGAVLVDTVIEAEAMIKPYTLCEQARVGPTAEAGPFARLRPGADLREGSRVGNFVEVKKAVLGKGSKANHLAYLGDAEVGEGVNIGAGTITCNYDGFGKHKTVLKDGVFIGSNSTLVAPLTVGKGAYVGAGSCVSRDVPDDALAIGRAKQDNKEGYAARIRSRNKRRALK